MTSTQPKPKKRTNKQIKGKAKPGLAEDSTRKNIQAVREVTNWKVDEDILRVLTESNNSVQVAIDKILSGDAGRPGDSWQEVSNRKKSTKDKSLEAIPIKSIRSSRGSGRGSTRGSRGADRGRGRGRGSLPPRSTIPSVNPSGAGSEQTTKPAVDSTIPNVPRYSNQNIQEQNTSTTIKHEEKSHIPPAQSSHFTGPSFSDIVKKSVTQNRPSNPTSDTQHWPAVGGSTVNASTGHSHDVSGDGQAHSSLLFSNVTNIPDNSSLESNLSSSPEAVRTNPTSLPSSSSSISRDEEDLEEGAGKAHGTIQPIQKPTGNGAKGRTGGSGKTAVSGGMMAWKPKSKDGSPSDSPKQEKNEQLPTGDENKTANNVAQPQNLLRAVGGGLVADQDEDEEDDSPGVNLPSSFYARRDTPSVKFRFGDWGASSSQQTSSVSASANETQRGQITRPHEEQKQIQQQTQPQQPTEKTDVSAQYRTEQLVEESDGTRTQFRSTTGYGAYGGIASGVDSELGSGMEHVPVQFPYGVNPFMPMYGFPYDFDPSNPQAPYYETPGMHSAFRRAGADPYGQGYPYDDELGADGKYSREGYSLAGQQSGSAGTTPDQSGNAAAPEGSGSPTGYGNTQPQAHPGHHYAVPSSYPMHPYPYFLQQYTGYTGSSPMHFQRPWRAFPGAGLGSYSAGYSSPPGSMANSFEDLPQEYRYNRGAGQLNYLMNQQQTTGTTAADGGQPSQSRKGPKSAQNGKSSQQGQQQQQQYDIYKGQNQQGDYDMASYYGSRAGYSGQNSQQQQQHQGHHTGGYLQQKGHGQ